MFTTVLLALLIVAPAAYGLWMLSYAASPQRILARRLQALSKRDDR